MSRPVASVLAAEDAPASFLAGRRRTGGGWEGVITARHRAGHRVDLVLRACPLRGRHGCRRPAVACDVTALQGWEPDQAVVRGLLEDSALGIAVLDIDLRLQRVNRPGRPDGTAPGE
ncbi:hypothetical protein ABZT08_20355 [Streptomyces sp. NPDC005526]|uniref:hypothetical protein n=1 Tax=Streptomyces sp. NPDC005526 TaxID=3156885 RepID=UPI0033A820A1